MKKLFKNLMALTEKHKGMFFFKDYKLASDDVVRIFSYNYASYSQWIEPDALECRGIMFLMNGKKPVRIMSRPMEKFFNIGENPLTMNLDFSTIKTVMAKADGSLVSSYVDSKGYLGLKSKSSVYSSQAAEAYQIISMLEHSKLYTRVKELAESSFTCNFEYVSPNNRIVLGYESPGLILLNVRDNISGDYVDYQDLRKDAVLSKYLVEAYELDTESDWIDEVRNMSGIEGFVIDLGTQRCKLKTSWYIGLHRTKDSINKNEDLFATIVNESSDDVKGMFIGDELAQAKIVAFEEAYLSWFTESLNTVEEIYKKLAGKDRKTFAVTGQADLKALGKPYLFGILMNAYQNGFDYEMTIKSLGEVFMKFAWKSHVPKKYKKEDIIFEG